MFILYNSLYKISNTKLDNINPPCVTVFISNITMLTYKINICRYYKYTTYVYKCNIINCPVHI